MTHAQPQKKSLWNMNVDLMHGPILKSLLLFMLPILISNLFQQLYNTVDTMIVGNVLGDTALAAIGSIYELLVGFGIGIGNGLAIVAARSYGAQDEDLLKRTVTGSIVIGLIASLVITAAGFFGLRPLLQLLDTPAEILEDAYSYIIVIDLGVVVMFMYNLCAGLLRAIGNSVMPLVFLLISSALNVGLDLWFIAGVGMGVRGAAVATVIAQGISVVLCILYVLAKVRILIPEKKHLAVGSHLYWELFSQSISMGLMSSIVSAGSVVLQYGINGLGTLTIAGHTAARKLFAFTDMPLISMANAGSTFVSQNRGANQPDRVRRGMRQMYLYSVVVTIAAVFLMKFGAEWMVRFISGSSEPIVLENGARYLLWNAPFYAVLGVLLCTRYALQSLGQKVLPLFSSVIELVGKVIFVLVFIPKFQYNAVILCEPIIWCFMALYLVLVYLHEPFVFPKKKM
jgi:putative MATE family efflux protein